MEKKTCKYCLESFPLIKFNKITKRQKCYKNGVWQGIDPACVDCRKSRNRTKAKTHYQKHQVQITETARKRFNTEKYRKYNRNYTRKKRKTDIHYRIKDNCRRRIGVALRNVGAKKSNYTMNLIGCSISELRNHLESQFKEGMTWENHSLHGWHIDHKLPCASFDLSKPEEQKKCFHYSNLQPLWAKDNRSKSNRII